MNGILILNKPSGPTSRDSVNRIQRVLPRKTKIGHAGTLDPLASGVLVLAIGSATRLVEYLQDKTNIATAAKRINQELGWALYVGTRGLAQLGRTPLEPAPALHDGDEIGAAPAATAVKKKEPPVSKTKKAAAQ